MTYCLAICELCGVGLPDTSGEGLCAACAVDAPTAPPEPIHLNAPRLGALEPACDLPGHELYEVIGSGGMGAVHRAVQHSLHRDVAVKVIAAQHCGAGDRERFLREARVLAQLDHPNIVPIHDCGIDDDGRCYYTMKLVRGRTLRTILWDVAQGVETWTLDRLLDVFRKVCDAVAFAHSRGILHRDLKPENVMVGEFGEVLVMDWGLAGMIKAGAETAEIAPVRNGRAPVFDSDAELTLKGIVLGTPQYMSPEQACARADLDERSDIYGLGGILYIILTLRAPVKKTTLPEMLESVRRGEIEPFQAPPLLTETSSVRWRIPAALFAVVRKAMALDRDERFPAVTALAADVDAHLGGFATSAEQIGVAGQLWLLVKRHRTVSVASLVLIAVSIAFVFQLMASERLAQASAQTAQRNENATRVALARANIALADSAYSGNDAGQMTAALEAVPPDLRDNAWHYLEGRSDDRQALLKWENNGFLIGSAAVPDEPGVFTAATPGDTHRIVTFDGKTGKVLRSFSHRGGWVRGIAYSPDGKLIAISRIQGDGVSIHRAGDGAEIAHWPSGWADSVAFCPDSKRLLQSDHHGCILWEAATGRALWKSPRGMTHLLLADGQSIAAVGENALHILSTEDGRVISTFPIKPSVPITASVSPDGSMLVVAHLDGTIGGIQIADGSQLFETPAGLNGNIQRTAFTPDGRRFISFASLRDSLQLVQIRDAATGRVLRHLTGSVGGIESLSIHPLSGDLIVTGTRSATWSLPGTREPAWKLPGGRVIGGFFPGDDSFLATADSGEFGAIALGKSSPSWRPSKQPAYAVAASGDGHVAAIHAGNDPDGSRDYQIFRSGRNGIVEGKIIRYFTDAGSLKLNCDGSRLAACGAWGDPAAWLAGTGESLPPLENSGITSMLEMAWHGSDPARLAGLFTVGGRRGDPGSQEWIIAWDTDTGRRVAGERHETPMNCLAAEPGGTRFAEAGGDNTVRIRDGQTLKTIREFRAHDGPINAIAWNPKRPMVATGSTDHSVRLWDVSTGRLIEELHIGLREPEAIYFSPNGKRLACVTPGEQTMIWELK